MTHPILITGGAGYIGSHTALALKACGFQPIILDNLATGHRWAAEKFGPFEQGDVGDAAFVARVCAHYKPVALLHFAAFIEVAESVQNPDKYFDNNTRKASILFDTAIQNGVKHVVFSSTAAVYGAVTTNAPITENQTTQPINPYGASKLEAETYLRTLPATSVTLRYFNAAGAAPEQGLGETHWPETHLIPNLVLAATEPTKTLSVFGTDYPTPDGTAIRDYIHVLDLADAHVRALRHLLEGGATAICNLGTGTGSSILHILETAERILGRPVKRTFAPRRAGDPAILVADASRAHQILGWKPTRALENILRSAATWHAGATYRTFWTEKNERPISS